MLRIFIVGIESRSHHVCQIVHNTWCYVFIILFSMYIMYFSVMCDMCTLHTIGTMLSVVVGWIASMIHMPQGMNVIIDWWPLGGESSHTFEINNNQFFGFQKKQN